MPFPSLHLIIGALISHHHEKKGEYNNIKYFEREIENHVHMTFIIVFCYNCSIFIVNSCSSLTVSTLRMKPNHSSVRTVGEKHSICRVWYYSWFHASTGGLGNVFSIEMGDYYSNSLKELPNHSKKYSLHRWSNSSVKADLSYIILTWDVIKCLRSLPVMAPHRHLLLSRGSAYTCPDDFSFVLVPIKSSQYKGELSPPPGHISFAKLLILRPFL